MKHIICNIIKLGKDTIKVDQDLGISDQFIYPNAGNLFKPGDRVEIRINTDDSLIYDVRKR